MFQVECCVKDDCEERYEMVAKGVAQYIMDRFCSLTLNEEIGGFDDVPDLKRNIAKVRVAEATQASANKQSSCKTGLHSSSTRKHSALLEDSELNIHVYKVHETNKDQQNAEDEQSDSEENNAHSLAQVSELPCAELEGLWDTLVFDDDIKGMLLRYVSTATLFAEMKVDANLISCNRYCHISVFVSSSVLLSVSVSVLAFLCPSWSISVRLCLSPSASGCINFYLFVSVYLCLSVSPSISQILMN